MKHTIIFFITALYLIAYPADTISFDKRPTVPLKQGVFLVATPHLTDPNFLHTVVLIVSYGKEGALGLIINRPAYIRLRQLLPDIEGIEKITTPLYIGGPVGRDNINILFTSDKPLDGAQIVFGNLYVTGRKDVIIPVLQNHEPDSKVRAYAGFAGWAPGQLEHEISRGSWITIEADLKTIFTDDPFRIWPSIFTIPEEIMI